METCVLATGRSAHIDWHKCARPESNRHSLSADGLSCRWVYLISPRALIYREFMSANDKLPKHLQIEQVLPAGVEPARLSTLVPETSASTKIPPRERKRVRDYIPCCRHQHGRSTRRPFPAVPRRGIEPPRAFARQILSLVRLPITPPRQVVARRGLEPRLAPLRGRLPYPLGERALLPHPRKRKNLRPAAIRTTTTKSTRMIGKSGAVSTNKTTSAKAPTTPSKKVRWSPRSHSSTFLFRRMSSH